MLNETVSVFANGDGSSSNLLLLIGIVFVVALGAIRFFSKGKKGESTRAESPVRKGVNLTIEDVTNVTFTATKISEGYDQNEVDDFLDEAVAELTRLQKEEEALRLARAEGGLPVGSSPILTPENVVNKRFAATKFRGGYSQNEVDDFLDEVVVELRRLTSKNRETRIEVSKIITETS